MGMQERGGEERIWRRRSGEQEIIKEGGRRGVFLSSNEEWRGKMRKGEIGEGSESARVGFFGGWREEKKRKSQKIRMEKKDEKEKKKNGKKRKKNQSLKGGRTYRIVTRLRMVWGNRDWGAKREKIGEKNGRNTRIGRTTGKKETQKKKR